MEQEHIYENPPPSIEEMYSTAISASNLRVESDRRNVADMVIAAGMNPHRLGLALRRLASEWDSTEKPPPMSDRILEALAAKYPRIQGTGLVLVTAVDRQGNTTEEQLIPLVAAKREADAWHAHELGKLFQRLQSLSWVRDALVYWADSRGIEGPVHVVGAVLQWWLNPICQVCGGVKKRVVVGTGRTSSKDCRGCKGTGETRVPHGSVGRKMLAYMNECQRASAKDLRGRLRK